MQQYLAGRHNFDILSVEKDTPISGKLFVDQRPDKDLKAKRFVINHSTFANMSFKSSSFIASNLSFCVFIGCYFRRTYFEATLFTGCKFIDCVFDDITLVGCDMRYSTFENCYIDYDVLIGSLPVPSNIRWKMCTNLALESLRSGDSEQYRKYFFEEMKSSEEHYWDMVIQRGKWYKDKYDTVDRFLGLFKFTKSKMSKYLWGYGEKISHLVIVILSVILIFSVIYYAQVDVFKEANSSTAAAKSLDFSESLYLSFCNFITITSDFTTNNAFVRLITAIEGVLGVVLMGFFVAALFRFINRR
ncbi:pentapeptide repeat-containing protein [Tumebacillus sp. DT12]|uniref:Pentapeptide repeat-containing protein n=1 Tax=Tumebacillus lacus TaxID=2995335 RepID=A0ABT3X550_9BACL|nr:pentapeptide repeat-containing protein [Tumebacillus lacus]MCX7572027.1 pentapeptide repeat-containing protein [Tumebacillus lacus]